MTELTNTFEVAFRKRTRPAAIGNFQELSDFEAGAIKPFEKIQWKDITCSLLSRDHEVVYWFSPQAFCYFLPGILSAGIREDNSDLLVYDSIVQMLDGSPNPAYWDEFFLGRWTLLDSGECNAIRAWMHWFMQFRREDYPPNTETRLSETLTLLASGMTGIRSRKHETKSNPSE